MKNRKETFSTAGVAMKKKIIRNFIVYNNE